LKKEKTILLLMVQVQKVVVQVQKVVVVQVQKVVVE
jgi:hypothetical protein